MVNAIQGRNIPVLNFAYHLSKPWPDQFAHVNDKQPILPVWSKTWGCSHTQAAADHRFMSWVRVVSVLLKTDNQSLKAKTSRTLDFRSLYSQRRQKILVKAQFIIKIAASVSLLMSMVNTSLHGQWFFWTVRKNIWSKEWALRKWKVSVLIFSQAGTTCSCKMQLNLRETKKCFEERYRCYGVPKLKLAFCEPQYQNLNSHLLPLYISQTNS